MYAYVSLKLLQFTCETRTYTQRNEFKHRVSSGYIAISVHKSHLNSRVCVKLSPESKKRKELKNDDYLRLVFFCSLFQII